MSEIVQRLLYAHNLQHPGHRTVGVAFLKVVFSTDLCGLRDRAILLIG